MSKYGELIKQARIPENQNTKQPENQINLTDNSQDTLEPEPEVNLCVKVPVSLRRHWAAEAKRQGITMTAVIIEALEAKFGKPE
jgi:predicted HicB family RNase H-like nuclease